MAMAQEGSRTAVLGDGAGFIGGAELTPEVLRRSFAHYPSGVTAICALLDGEPVGMAASSFASVSLDPPLVSVCMAHTSETWPKLRSAERLGVSVLSHHHGAVARALAAKTGDRFASVDWVADSQGSVFIGEATLWLDCTLSDQVRAGDHDIVILNVERVASNPDIAPIVFHGSTFRALA